MTSRNDKQPDCLHCIHYFVSWEPDKPRGCRAYEFKAAELPSEVALASSGHPCRSSPGFPTDRNERS